jgi:predicted nucleic acid-binding protein
MILVDTAYLLALLLPRDSLFQRAQAWAQAVSETLVVTHYVLLEAANALSSPLDRPKFHTLMTRMQADTQIEVVPASAALWEAGLRLHEQRPDKTWSLTDCIFFVVMEQRGIRQALIFDHHFEQAGFEALLRRDPQA